MAGREEAEEAGGGVGARRAAMRMGYGVVRGKSGVEGGEVRRHGRRSGGQGSFIERGGYLFITGVVLSKAF